MDPYFNHFKLLQTISILYILVIVTCTRSPITLDEECLALFQFKQSLINQDDPTCDASWLHTFHSWKPRRNESADNGFDCCLWDGVECSNDDEYGHVIGLDLSESFLCGHVNSSSTLFSLVHLQSLNLAMNDFYGSQIPFEISRLKQLKNLNLSESGFSGQIPNEISQLMHLSSIDLSWNPLKLQSPSLKHLVQNLTGLEELHLSWVEINSSIPHLLANFTSLRSIMLQNCLLHNEFTSVILELPKLKILDLSSNTNLTGSFPEFRNNSLLECINVAYTSFFGTIPESISNLNNLKVLYLSDCSFSGRIGGSLSNLTQLTFLGLGGNKFSGLFPSLESLSKLDFGT